MPRLIKFIANDKLAPLPPDLEVINGEEVIIMGELISFVKKIIATVIGRFVYDWLKHFFKGGD